MPRRLLHLPQSRHTPRLWCPALPHLCGHRAAALSRHSPVQCDTQYTHSQCWFNVIPLKTGGPAIPRTARAWYPYIRLVFLFFMWDQVSLLEIQPYIHVSEEWCGCPTQWHPSTKDSSGTQTHKATPTRIEMHRNGLNIFLYTSDQPLDTVLFFTTTQQKLFWSSRFTGAHYNYCRSTGSTLEADTKGRLLYNFIRRGHSVHSDSWGQAKTNWVYHSLLWNRTKERKKETEIVLYSMPSIYWALKDGYCAPLRRHPCGFITAQRWLLLMASVSQIFGEMWNGTTQTFKSHPGPQASPDVSSPQPGWCGDFCTTAILTFCPNTNHFENPIVECLHMWPFHRHRSLLCLTEQLLWAQSQTCQSQYSNI